MENLAINKEKPDYAEWFNKNFSFGLKQILKFSIQNPRMAAFMAARCYVFIYQTGVENAWKAMACRFRPCLSTA